jgi:hypothetical protein
MITQLIWPDARPMGITPFRWTLDGGGRELIKNIINQHGMSSMLEIGVFLGGGTLELLEACPDLYIFGLDKYEEPYPEFASIGHYYIANRRIYQSAIDRSGISEHEFLVQMSRPLAQRDAVISNLWPYRDRFAAIKGRSPDVLPELAMEGIYPDIVFLDSDKSGRELPIISALWPRSVISGDDWTWCDPSGRNSLRAVVRSIAARRDMSLIVKDAVWVLEPHDRQLV